MENDIDVLTSTIHYNALYNSFTAYDSNLHWYSIPAERVRPYAARYGLTNDEAVEELIKFAMVERGFEHAKH